MVCSILLWWPSTFVQSLSDIDPSMTTLKVFQTIKEHPIVIPKIYCGLALWFMMVYLHEFERKNPERTRSQRASPGTSAPLLEQMAVPAHEAPQLAICAWDDFRNKHGAAAPLVGWTLFNWDIWEDTAQMTWWSQVPMMVTPRRYMFWQGSHLLSQPVRPDILFKLLFQNLCK